jgi:hypothetical protein
LGGKNNYAVDKEAGDEAIRAYPDMLSSVRANPRSSGGPSGGS